MGKLSIPEVLIVVVFTVAILGFRLFRWGRGGRPKPR